jgi:hypothetical protein
MPDLVQYSLALPKANVDRVAFARVQSRDPWMLVSLSCVRPRGDDAIAVRVELDVGEAPPFSLTPRLT